MKNTIFFTHKKRDFDLFFDKNALKLLNKDTRFYLILLTDI